MLTNKLIKKKTDRHNTKEQYKSFIVKKTRKPVKQSEISTHQPKTFNIVDIKLVIAEHPKTSHKISKTIRKD